jgi:hypothetical protein
MLQFCGRAGSMSTGRSQVARTHSRAGTRCAESLGFVAQTISAKNQRSHVGASRRRLHMGLGPPGLDPPGPLGRLKETIGRGDRSTDSRPAPVRENQAAGYSHPDGDDRVTHVTRARPRAA